MTGNTLLYTQYMPIGILRHSNVPTGHWKAYDGTTGNTLYRQHCCTSNNVWERQDVLDRQHSVAMEHTWYNWQDIVPATLQCTGNAVVPATLYGTGNTVLYHWQWSIQIVQLATHWTGNTVLDRQHCIVSLAMKHTNGTTGNKMYRQHMVPAGM